MSDNNVRIWRRIPTDEDPCEDWHVSVGSATSLQDLAVMAGDSCASGRLTPRAALIGGLCWDEALEMVSLAMITPGALRPWARQLEPPIAGGWLLVVEISAVDLLYFNLSTPGEFWDRLTLGETLATFVRLTFPREWGGFRAARQASFALEVRAS